jgi:hypothetical protein
MSTNISYSSYSCYFKYQGNFYITFNVKAAIVVTILRSLTDFIYFLHMLLQVSLTSLLLLSFLNIMNDLVFGYGKH